MADVNMRPMSLGEVLDRTFSLYKSHFLLFTGLTALPFLVLLLFNVGNSAYMQMVRNRTSTPQTVTPPLTGAIGFIVLGAIGGLVLYLFLLGMAQAATVFAVSDLYLNQEPGLRECYRRVGMKGFRVAGVIILVTLVSAVGFLLLIIPGIILLCRTAVSVPVSMLEDTNPIRSIERSMELTKDFALQVFAIMVIVWIISWILGIIFQFPLFFFAFTAAKSHTQLPFAALLIEHFGGFIAQVLAAPIGTIALSLMYYNLRVSKEAFDLQHLMATMNSDPAQSAPTVA